MRIIVRLNTTPWDAGSGSQLQFPCWAGQSTYDRRLAMQIIVLPANRGLMLSCACVVSGGSAVVIFVKRKTHLERRVRDAFLEDSFS